MMPQLHELSDEKRAWYILKGYVIRDSPGGKRREWFLNGQRHRHDGPAIEWAQGDRFWYLNGKLHREDGPAVAYKHGTKYWYLNGKNLSEEKYLTIDRQGSK